MGEGRGACFFNKLMILLSVADLQSSRSDNITSCGFNAV